MRTTLLGQGATVDQNGVGLGSFGSSTLPQTDIRSDSVLPWISARGRVFYSMAGMQKPSLFARVSDE